MCGIVLCHIVWFRGSKQSAASASVVLSVLFRSVYGPPCVNSVVGSKFDLVSWLYCSCVHCTAMQYTAYTAAWLLVVAGDYTRLDLASLARVLVVAGDQSKYQMSTCWAAYKKNITTGLWKFYKMARRRNTPARFFYGMARLTHVTKLSYVLACACIGTCRIRGMPPCSKPGTNYQLGYRYIRGLVRSCTHVLVCDDVSRAAPPSSFAIVKTFPDPFH